MGISAREAVLHGRRIGYLHLLPEGAPTDDPLVLVHGLAGTSATWKPLLAELDRRGRTREVIAVDLPGHGRSQRPHGDYSIAGYANVVRDLLVGLGHRHVTLVGHSLGGGVALQFSYQFPQMCGRVVLVDSGGLGTGVSRAIRAANLPGTAVALPLIANRLTVALARAVVGRRVEARELVEHFGTLASRDARTSFVRTVRASVGLGGQRVSATEKLYLAEDLPSLVIWGTEDRVIPVGHGRRAADLMPGSRLVELEGAGHFPHVAQPAWFADVLLGFLDETTPARLDVEDLAHHVDA
ncbi:alpha/beta fold hydrolase [Actinokineospora spheciospongiae]|uniref:alpha/beta fold hydrolase n=1 Tax=Actinokineospora spheciospongiae TaxID=909613 RepID=UPI0004B13F84|nr:alpha/beta hydrolase [Actinokineospora spheciospongiae]